MDASLMVRTSFDRSLAQAFARKDFDGSEAVGADSVLWFDVEAAPFVDGPCPLRPFLRDTLDARPSPFDSCCCCFSCSRAA